MKIEAIGFCAIAVATLEAQTAPLSCKRDWGLPVQIGAEQGGLYLRPSQLVPHSDSLTVLGTSVVVIGSRLSGEPLIGATVLGKGSSVIPSPQAGPLRFPLGAFTDDAVFHIAWSQPSAHDPSGLSNSLWYAARGRTGWSVPKRLVETSVVTWDERGGVVLTANRDVHVLAAMRNHAGGSGIAYARKLQGTWTTSLIPVAGLPSELSALLLPHDSILVAFAATDVRAGVSNGAHIFVLRAATRDSLWPRATRIQWSGPDAAWAPRLVRLVGVRYGPRSAALAWGHIPKGSLAIDSIGLALSFDGGGMWSMQASAPFDLQSSDFELVSDRGGGLHVLGAWRDATSGTLRPRYAAWKNGSWSASQVLPFTIEGRPRLAILASDSLVVGSAQASGRPSVLLRGRPCD